jgi:hypothetical protein
MRSELTYNDIGFTGACREEEQDPDAGACQVSIDLTCPVTFFTHWKLTRVDWTLAAQRQVVSTVRLVTT